MAKPRLIRALLVGLSIAFSLADCSSVPRAAFTREQQDVAVIPGIADARIWADDPTGLSRTAPFSGGQREPKSFDVLALSGGGAEGAFGAGLLVGWTKAGNRPDFSIVSGTSSGALIAPFAFLGASHDAILRDLFTLNQCTIRRAAARRSPREPLAGPESRLLSGRERSG